MNLTPYQRDVLELIFFGKTNGEIAQILGVREVNARNTVKTVISALGAYNRCSAIYVGLRLGLLRPPVVVAQSDEIADPAPIVRGDLELDPGTRRLKVNGTQVHLKGFEYRLAEFFLKHCGRVFDRGALIDHVWGRDHAIEPRTVDVHIHRLHKTLAKHGCGHLIKTERGVGYVCERAAA